MRGEENGVSIEELEARPRRTMEMPSSSNREV